MAKKKLTIKEQAKKLREWYQKRSNEGLDWEQANKIIIDKYRISEDKHDYEIYEILVTLPDKHFREIRKEFDVNYNGERTV